MTAKRYNHHLCGPNWQKRAANFSDAHGEMSILKHLPLPRYGRHQNWSSHSVLFSDSVPFLFSLCPTEPKINPFYRWLVHVNVFQSTALKAAVSLGFLYPALLSPSCLSFIWQLYELDFQLAKCGRKRECTLPWPILYFCEFLIQANL